MKLQSILLTLFVLTASNLVAMDSADIPGNRDADVQQCANENSEIKVVKLKEERALTEKILTRFFAAHRGRTPSNTAIVVEKDENWKESYEFYKDQQIELNAIFSAHDEKPFQYPVKDAVDAMDETIFGSRFPRAHGADSVVIKDQFTTCHLLRYTDVQGRYKAVYYCMTKLDPEHKEWVHEVKNNARK